jgi:hypothetical protein
MRVFDVVVGGEKVLENFDPVSVVDIAMVAKHEFICRAATSTTIRLYVFDGRYPH